MGEDIPPRLLLVEDDFIVSVKLRASLEGCGYAVQTAGTGEEALAAVRDAKAIDLILMDIALGKGMDGTEAALAILKIRELPIIFVSSHSDRETVGKAERIGSYGYVEKRSSPAVLDAAIRMAIKLFRATRELRSSEARLAHAEKVAKIGNWRASLDTGEVSLSPGARHIYGLADGKVSWSELAQCRLPEYREAVDEAHSSAILRRLPYDIEFGMRRPSDGRTVFLRAFGEFEEESNSIIGVIQDITERKTAESQKIESEGWHRRLFDKLIAKLPAGLYTLRSRPSGQYSFDFASPRLAQILGVSLEAILADHLAAYAHIHPEDLHQLDEINRVHIASRQPFAWEGRTLVEGVARWITIQSTPEPLADGDVLWHGIVSDITERKEIEEALSQERNLITELMDNSPDYIYFKDLEGRFQRTSKAHARRMGLDDPARAVGRTDFDFFSEDFARKTRSEEELVITSGNTMNIDERDILLDGSSEYVQTIKMPVKNARGEIVGTCGISRNVTESRMNERRIKQLLEEKELLLREVHHRIKNNMNSMKSLVYLQRKSVTDARTAEALEDVENRFTSMSILYDKLHRSEAYSGVSVRDYLPTLIEEIVHNFPSGSSVTLRNDIEDFVLDTRIAQTLGIMLNELLTNIMKYAFREGGEALIETGARLRDGGVTLSIRDNGVGMPEDVDFENSTGFGLMLIKELTRQIGGRIRIERGSGTRIVLEFAL